MLFECASLCFNDRVDLFCILVVVASGLMWVPNILCAVVVAARFWTGMMFVCEHFGFVVPSRVIVLW